MRKIEIEMCAAIREGRNWKKSNTQVLWEQGRVSILLHGWCIAEGSNGVLTLDRMTLARWPTRTTTSRLNALGFSVYQRNYEIIVEKDQVVF